MAFGDLPYGLRDVKLQAYTAAGALSATKVDLPNSQVFSFEEAEEFTDLRGDDRRVAVRGQGPSVDWSLEAGGISFAAYEVLTGGTITETGLTPNIVKTLSKKTTDTRPYFKVEGQAISDSGGDFHAVVYKCRATGNIGGELGDGEFFITSCEGEAVGDAGDKLYDLVQNETTTAIA